MAKLTKTYIDGLKAEDKPVYYWDDYIKGFGLKVLPTGNKKYVFKYRISGGGRRGQQRWYAIGTHGTITPDKARQIAQQVAGAIAEGRDPQGQKLAFRNAATIHDLWKRFEKEHLGRRKPSTSRHYKQIWAKHIKPRLGTKKVVDVNRDDIHRLHHQMSSHPYQANRAVAVLSKMFNLAEVWGMRPDGSNPCRHVEKYPERSRERYLNEEELGRLGEALQLGLAAQTETPHMVAAIELLLFTGARVGEILGARWEWVDYQKRVIALPDSKTGAKNIYLSDDAIAVLKRLEKLPQRKKNDFVIAGGIKKKPLSDLRHPWLRIRERAGLEGVRLHDLRHTAASIGVTVGMNLPVIGRLLGHTQAQTTQRYAHVANDPALAAADQIGAHIRAAMSKQTVS
ncbi:MAG: tyrosine-type recombinase/integrase [Rhodospirillales bacterium]|nr:tyrosine-type recombinase/integrase [Rhodospirillales bacterium]NET38400.1 tyrosine-type recombinase/integrase [Cyanothece sp. SIO1E1]